MHKGFGLAAAVALTAVVGTAANAADKLKIGVTATLEGTYTVLGEDGMRGYELAVKAHGGKAGGKEIETIVGSTDASPDSAVRAAKKLVEQDKVDVLISPLSGSEGIAIRDYSKTQPQITVINASSGARGDDLWRSVRRHHAVADLLSASTWTAPSGTPGSATTSTTSRATRRSRRSARTTRSSTRR